MRLLKSSARRGTRVAIVAALLSAGAQPAHGQPDRQAASASRVTVGAGQRAPAGSDPVIETALLARRLAQYGRATRSPLPLLAAAQILLDNPARPLEEGTSFADPADTVAAYTTGPGRDLDPARILAEARLLAAGNDALLTVVQQLERRAEAQARGQVRGVVAGPRLRYGRLAPGARRSYGIRFSGAQNAVVYVSGDGEVPLELAVFDPRGDQVVVDRGTRDKSVVEWRPTRTMRFTVQVSNRGAQSTWYVLLTN